LGHPSKFQRVSRLGFVTAATSINGSQPNFAQYLAVSWAATLYIHFWRLLPHNGILPGAKFTLRPSLCCPILSALLHGTRIVALSRGRHLYSAGRPSRWASAHILGCLCYAAVFNDCLEQRDLRNYQIDLHQIFRTGRYVAVDVQLGIGFTIGQGT